jgi:hypothetical protein
VDRRFGAVEPEESDPLLVGFGVDPVGFPSKRRSEPGSNRRAPLLGNQAAAASEWTIALGAREALSSEVRQRVSRELLSFVRDIDPKTAPKRLKLPTGESVADAARMTAIKCHCLLLARKIHGSGFVKVESEYEALAKDLPFWVMRHNFNTGDKGSFLLPSLHHFSPSALRPRLLPVGRLQRTPVSSHRRDGASSIRIQRRLSKGLCSMGQGIVEA